MTPALSAMKSVPDFAKGHVKDLRARWALEEAGLRYEEVLVDHDERAGEDYRRWQPFGQVPAYRDGTTELFESGAIVLHIAERSDALAPREQAARARMTAWVFAALNSVEPYVTNLILADLAYGEEPWMPRYKVKANNALRDRLGLLAAWLGDNEYLEDRFTAGDLIMSSVLRDLPEGELDAFASLKAYRERCTARPAFARALDAQLDAFRRFEAA